MQLRLYWKNRIIWKAFYYFDVSQNYLDLEVISLCKKIRMQKRDTQKEFRTARLKI